MDLITLPDARTMMIRLRRACDLDHFVEQFYPRLTKHAGEEKYPQGIDLLVELAFYDYCEGLPPQVAVVGRLHLPAIKAALRGDTPDT